MPFFEKHKALLITCLFMGVMLLGLHSINLSNRQQKKLELLLELKAEVIDQVIPDSRNKELDEEPQKNVPKSKELDNRLGKNAERRQKTHRAFNESTQKDREAFQKRLAALKHKLDAHGDLLEDRNENDTGFGSGATDQNSPMPPKRNNAPKKDLEESIQESKDHESSMSFLLIKRRALKLPNPVYTCDHRGKIVVTIRVNQYGHVIHAAIDQQRSDSKNGCLHDSALRYARRAQFSKSHRFEQTGSISYQFNE